MMGTTQKQIPYGHRLLPVLLDEIAAEDPNRVYALIPRSSNLSDGFREVLYADLARAVDRAAGWLEGQFGRSRSFEVLAYIGPSDLRYHAFILGANKVGFQLLLPSPRNSIEGQLNLFEITKTRAMLTAEGYHLPEAVLKKSLLPVLYVPSLDSMLSPGKVEHYTFDKSYEEAKSDPFLVMHTSGSTGLPKAVFCKHGWAAIMDAMQDLPDLNGHQAFFPSLANKRIYPMLPPFHSGGVTITLLNTLWRNSCSVWGPSDRPPSTVIAEEVLNQVSVDLFIGAPSTIEEMMQQPSSRAVLEGLVSVGYGGGPLSPEAGAVLNTKTRLTNIIGQTELCAPPIYLTDKEDWEYFHYNPIHKGIEFRHIGGGMHEQVLVRHPSTDKYHGVWSTFPNLNEYHINDLYTKHPTKPNLWLHVGRGDDVIALSNGEKLNPTSMESTLRGCAGVRGALVVGQGRFSVAAILELTEAMAETLPTSEEKTRFIEKKIWKLAVEANKSAPAHAQLSLDKIIVGSIEKPFPRAGKGTVQRIAAVKLYEEEINELYQRSDTEVAIATDLHTIDLSQSDDELESEISALVESIIGVKGLKPEQDFFSAGMDSLQVMTLVKKLLTMISGLSRKQITTRLVYSNSTIKSLSAALRDTCSTQDIKYATSQEQTVNEILEKFVQQLPTAATAAKKVMQSKEKLVVLLTGSTGSLGSYLLHSLVESQSVAKIYCLNRRPDAAEIQVTKNAECGLISEWDNRVQFLHGDLSDKSLGLNKDVYSKLRDEISVIIHNQWQVNFNLALSSYEQFILGTLNLIKLSAFSPISPSIFFTSSIGAVGNWASKHGSLPVPEAALPDPSTPLPQGYSESKWITERLLDAASAQSGVSSVILRVGQIAGPVEVGSKGMWNRHEWLPSLVASSKYMCCIPAQLPVKDNLTWIPVDFMAQIILELVGKHCLHPRPASTAEPRTEYYHLVNPFCGKWEDLVPAVQQYFSSVNMRVVTFGEWVEKLKKSSEDESTKLMLNPALKLLDFYQSMLTPEGIHDMKFDTKCAQSASSKLKELESVGAEWMKLWLRQWDF